MQNTKEIKKINKNNKGLFIIIVILLLVIAGLIGFIVVNNIQNNNQLEENTKEKEDKEQELTDQSIIDNINKKIQYLTNESTDGVTGAYAFRNGEISDFGDVFHNLDEDLKLYIVLDYLYKENKFHDLAPENESDPLIANYVQNMGAKDVKQITGEEVKNEYKNFFGTDKVNLNALKERSCFDYNYEAEKNLFYKKLPTCGGTSVSLIYTYKNKYTIKGDNVYLYENYGIMKPSGQDSNQLTIYKGLETNEEYKRVSSPDEGMSFRIDSENYKEFSEYKYTFKKDAKTGNYYFISLEKIK